MENRNPISHVIDNILFYSAGKMKGQDQFFSKPDCKISKISASVKKLGQVSGYLVRNTK